MTNSYPFAFFIRGGPVWDGLADLRTMQPRIYFALDDNDDDGRNDYIGYYTGDNAISANRQQFVVTYQ